MSHILPAEGRDAIFQSITRSAESDSTKIALCESLELAACRAENAQMKQKLAECEAAILNLKTIVATIADKQVDILQEVVELRKITNALQMTPNVGTTLNASSSTGQNSLTEWNSWETSSMTISTSATIGSGSERDLYFPQDNEDNDVDEVEEEDEDDNGDGDEADDEVDQEWQDELTENAAFVCCGRKLG